MAVFGARRRVDELEAENVSLRQWVAYLQGTDAVTLAAEIRSARGELAQVQAHLAATRAEADRAHGEAAAARASIVETRELAMLQEVGIYDYHHPLDTALAYKQRLDEVKKRVRSMVSDDHAVNAAVGWTVNNSRAQGERMVRDMKKLMLRAYNAEADNAVRTASTMGLELLTQWRSMREPVPGGWVARRRRSSCWRHGRRRQRREPPAGAGEPDSHCVRSS